MKSTLPNPARMSSGQRFFFAAQLRQMAGESSNADWKTNCHALADLYAGCERWPATLDIPHGEGVPLPIQPVPQVSGGSSPGQMCVEAKM